MGVKECTESLFDDDQFCATSSCSCGGKGINALGSRRGCGHRGWMGVQMRTEAFYVDSRRVVFADDVHDGDSGGGGGTGMVDAALHGRNYFTSVGDA